MGMNIREMNNRGIMWWGIVGALAHLSCICTFPLWAEKTALGPCGSALLLLLAAVARAPFPRVAGPYRWVRHPIYASYMLAWLAGAAASGQFWLLIHAAYMYALYAEAARLEEVRLLRSPHGLEYVDYPQRT
ncbi:MAG: hypothetical protein FJX76_14155, partial [Armatimonadetes bacterium]|nr:hypothetical protein [Armatimonadota bacterium]